jgi:hypothetical protein
MRGFHGYRVLVFGGLLLSIASRALP